MKTIIDNHQYKVFESSDPEELLAELRTGKWRLAAYYRHGKRYRMRVVKRKKG